MAYALVESGVTYLQLYEYIKSNNIPLWIDCPSGSPTSSISGNITERIENAHQVGYNRLGLGPVPLIKGALEKTNLTLKDIDEKYQDLALN